MDGYDVKKVMDQVHISSEMQEEIIMNIQKRLENGKKNTRAWSWRKLVVAGLAFVLLTGVVSVPARAFVIGMVKERMASIPTTELREINDMVQGQQTLADSFSREYSAEEKERSQELWQAYNAGTFPENTITLVDKAEDAPEGTLCYIRSTGVFNLPDRKMTDEEILEIIDFQHEMSYAVSQGPAAQAARAEMQAEKNQLLEKIAAEGGISEAEAIEIATKQMNAELGERAAGKEILKYEDGSLAVRIEDISEQTDYEHKGDLAYCITFMNPNDHSSTFFCTVDAMDGSVLDTSE